MSYFESTGFQKDFNNLLKSILLISKKLEDVTHELQAIRESLSDKTKESTTDQFVAPPNICYTYGMPTRARENIPM